MKKITSTVVISDVYLEVKGYYYPEEPEERYDDNMEGYPGCPAQFSIISVKVEGINITEIISDEVYCEIIDKIVEQQS